MPRAVKKFWSAERRLDWIDDRFAQGLTVNRNDIADYFGIDRSIGSGDIKRYSELGGKIEKTATGYEATTGWQSIRGSTADRIKAWRCWEVK